MTGVPRGTQEAPLPIFRGDTVPILESRDGGRVAFSGLTSLAVIEHRAVRIGGYIWIVAEKLILCRED